MLTFLSRLRTKAPAETPAVPEFLAGEGARVYSLDAARKRRSERQPRPRPAPRAA